MSKPKCGSGYCRLQSTEEGVELCPAKGGGCEYREEKPCEDCTWDGWKSLQKENEILNSQLARFSQHPFDPDNRETWPKEFEEVLIFNGEFRSIGTFTNGSFYDKQGNWVWCKWWSYLPGEEG